MNDWHFFVGLGILALGVVGVVSFAIDPAKAPWRGAIRGAYDLLNYRPMVKPFEKRAREIYEEDDSAS